MPKTIVKLEDLTPRQVEAIKSHRATLVYTVPNCDYCAVGGTTRKAKVDARGKDGRWANMCAIHRHVNAVATTDAQLGTGFGQELIESKVLTSEMVRGETDEVPL